VPLTAETAGRLSPESGTGGSCENTEEEGGREEEGRREGGREGVCTYSSVVLLCFCAFMHICTMYVIV
jgi:hypothetical protein